MGNPRTTPDSFWKKVVKTEGCWEWSGALYHNGYGSVMVDYQHWRAHRYAWTITHGPIPPGLVIMHLCDNRICVNPDHLKLGTHQDNILDCVSKNRHRWRKRSGK